MINLISPFKVFGNMKTLAIIQALFLLSIWVLFPSQILP